ncbi:MAG: hypothetical protein ACOCQD_00680 [archaeon]
MFLNYEMGIYKDGEWKLSPVFFKNLNDCNNLKGPTVLLSGGLLIDSYNIYALQSPLICEWENEEYFNSIDLAIKEISNQINIQNEDFIKSWRIVNLWTNKVELFGGTISSAYKSLIYDEKSNKWVLHKIYNDSSKDIKPDIKKYYDTYNRPIVLLKKDNLEVIHGRYFIKEIGHFYDKYDDAKTENEYLNRFTIVDTWENTEEIIDYKKDRYIIKEYIGANWKDKGSYSTLAEALSKIDNNSPIVIVKSDDKVSYSQKIYKIWQKEENLHEYAYIGIFSQVPNYIDGAYIVQNLWTGERQKLNPDGSIDLYDDVSTYELCSNEISNQNDNYYFYQYTALTGWLEPLKTDTLEEALRLADCIKSPAVITKNDEPVYMRKLNAVIENREHHEAIHLFSNSSDIAIDKSLELWKEKGGKYRVVNLWTNEIFIELSGKHCE